MVKTAAVAKRFIGEKTVSENGIVAGKFASCFLDKISTINEAKWPFSATFVVEELDIHHARP